MRKKGENLILEVFCADRSSTKVVKVKKIFNGIDFNVSVQNNKVLGF